MRNASILSRSRALLAAALIVSGLALPAFAAEPLAFVIPDEDGYGIAECFAAGNACGQGMADGWCEAHGHVKAVAFGSNDVTGSIAGRSAAAGAGGISIRCGD